jgi:DNA-binding beta-propeller fold protein YncE
VRIDLATGHVGTPFPHSQFWYSIALAPTGHVAYVTNGRKLAAVDLRSKKFVRSLTVAKAGSDVAITRDGKTAYLTNGLNGSIYPVDLAKWKMGPSLVIPGGAGADDITIAPDGLTAYVTSTLESAVGPPGSHSETSSVIPVNLVTHVMGSPITVYHGPYDIAVAQNGRMAYVTTDGPWLLAIDLATGSAAGTIHLPVVSDNIAAP